MSNVVPINGNGADAAQGHQGPTAIADIAPPTFQEFWQIFPKKVAKLDAEKAWKRLTPAQCVEAMSILPAWKRVWNDPQFTPFPATWLNGHRWEDELPEKWGKTHASQAIAVLPEQVEHTAMPDEVREKLKEFNRKFGTKVNI